MRPDDRARALTESRRMAGLTLFFCRRGSLQGWNSDGFLERELALYRILAAHLERLTFVTYGFEGDEAFRPALGQSELERRAADLGVRLSLPGRLPHAELPALLATCDLFVLPSRYEGHPKTLLEAMAAGLPVVGTDVEELRPLAPVLEHAPEEAAAVPPDVRGRQEAAAGEPDEADRPAPEQPDEVGDEPPVQQDDVLVDVDLVAPPGGVPEQAVLGAGGGPPLPGGGRGGRLCLPPRPPARPPRRCGRRGPRRRGSRRCAPPWRSSRRRSRSGRRLCRRRPRSGSAGARGSASGGSPRRGRRRRSRSTRKGVVPRTSAGTRARRGARGALPRRRRAPSGTCRPRRSRRRRAPAGGRGLPPERR